MHPIHAQLNHFIAEKNSRLAVSADVTTAQELLDLTERTADSIVVLKTHIDIIRDFTPDLPKKLRDIADRKHFLIFEDRKFADIGNTVQEQYAGGIYHIADWADIINAHPIVGPGIIDGLHAASSRAALLLLAQMTPKGNLFTTEYALRAAALAAEYPDYVMGFIGSADAADTLTALRAASPTSCIMTPGIQLGATGDALSQTYCTPQKARSLGADIIIVGRGITKAADPKAAAELYRAESIQLG